jgi:hypothetical protein
MMLGRNLLISLGLLALLAPAFSAQKHKPVAAKSSAKSAAKAAAKARKPAAPEDQSGQYAVQLDKPAQVIWGLGFEIQSDSIGSGNDGLPEKPISVPHDLVLAERQRLYKEMLKGFRYCRLALGLYLRGTDQDGKLLRERYTGQMKDLVELQAESGIEGYQPEYWSPLPYWKSNGKYTGKGGTLKSFDPEFLSAFGDALVQDVKYLQSSGLKVVHWGLQNEPEVGHGKYSTCYYTPENYLKAFKIVAPKIRAAFPDVKIHATSWDGQGGKYGKLLANDPEALKYVDQWTWHKIGASSDLLIKQQKTFAEGGHGKPVFNNEYEYLDNFTNDDRFVNTAQSIMNWFVFANSPTFTWLHALKPTTNAEASGYSLGFWRPETDTKPGKYPDLKTGHWVYNPQNYNAVAGFIRHMPWDSTRLAVQEDKVRLNNRILVFRTPAGKLGLAVSNRQMRPFTFHIATGRAGQFEGFQYTPKDCSKKLETKSGKILDVTLPAQSVEFWIER